jgi:hypothetical protein
MTIHADIERGDPGMPALFRGEVTVQAWDLEVASVQFM